MNESFKKSPHKKILCNLCQKDWQLEHYIPTSNGAMGNVQMTTDPAQIHAIHV